MNRRCTIDDYRMPADFLARRLLGHVLVRINASGERSAAMIVETEAYMGVQDSACHSFQGRRTPRVEPMYGHPGTAYVYFTYGMHHCFNIVAGERDEPVAVLIRAAQPVEGIDLMRGRRTLHRRAAKHVPDTLLCAGPARLCQALAIDLSHSGLDLTRSDHVWVEQPLEPNPDITQGSRIGIEYASEPWRSAPLRFWIRGNPHVSRNPSATNPLPRQR